MDKATSSEKEHIEYPEGKVVSALDPNAVEAAVADLREAGFASDVIDIITADEIEDVETPFDQTGLKGLLARIFASIGGDLQRLELARRELAAGHVLVTVKVDEDDKDEEQKAIRRVAEILRAHGGHQTFHAGRWTVTWLS